MTAKPRKQSTRYILSGTGTQRHDRRMNAHNHIDRLPEGKSWCIEIFEHHETRTLRQNAALYAVAEETLAEFCGLRGEAELKALHRELCCLYFGRVDLPLGYKPKRTTTTDENGNRAPLNTKQMADFYDFIQQQAAEIGCFIPDPDPLWKQRGRWKDEPAGQIAA